jgi:hypothetical protein
MPPLDRFKLATQVVPQTSKEHFFFAAKVELSICSVYSDFAYSRLG